MIRAAMSRYTADVPIAPRLPYPFAAAFLVAGLLCAAAAPSRPQAQTSANRGESSAACGRADPAYIRTPNKTGGTEGCRPVWDLTRSPYARWGTPRHIGPLGGKGLLRGDDIS
jgi:hypothetical protein